MSYPQEKGGDPWFWILLIGFIVMILFAIFPLIIKNLAVLKYYEMELVSSFSNKAVAIQKWISLQNPDDVKNWNMTQYFWVMQQAGLYYALFLFFIPATLAILLKRKSVKRRFSKRYTIESLKRTQALVSYPIRPLVGLDILKQPAEKGPWSVPFKPNEYIMLKGLDRYIIADDSKRHLFEQGLFYHFRKQIKNIAPSFEGFDALPNYYQALFVALAYFTINDKKAAHRFLEQFANSYYTPDIKKKDPHFNASDLNMKGVMDAATILLKNPEVYAILKRHASWETKLMGLMQAGRAYNNVKESAFIWLRPIDKTLFLALANLGRPSFFIEAETPALHFVIEHQIAEKYPDSTGILDFQYLWKVVHQIYDNEKPYFLEKNEKMAMAQTKDKELKALLETQKGRESFYKISTSDIELDIVLEVERESK